MGGDAYYRASEQAFFPTVLRYRRDFCYGRSPVQSAGAARMASFTQYDGYSKV